MEGVRVLEVAQYTFTPAAGAVMADWGADVIKVEHAVTGDAQRGIKLGTGGAAAGSFQPLKQIGYACRFCCRFKLICLAACRLLKKRFARLDLVSVPEPRITWHDPTYAFRRRAHLQQPYTDVHCRLAAAQDDIAFEVRRKLRKHIRGNEPYAVTKLEGGNVGRWDLGV